MTASLFPRDLGLLLIFPVVEVTVVLPSLNGLKSRWIMHWPGEELGPSKAPPGTTRVAPCSV